MHPNLRAVFVATVTSAIILFLGFYFIWPGSDMDFSIYLVISAFSIPFGFILAAIGVILLKSLEGY